jgi:superfamily I DNA and/or RNA helicase
MYHDLLLSHPSNSSHTLRELPAVRATLGLEPLGEEPPTPLPPPSPSPLSELASTVLLLVDTAGCNMAEDECKGGSYRNTAEAELVVAHIYRLYALGVSPDQIGVITPYNGQLEVLREMIAQREIEREGGEGDVAISAKGT